jgi:hypothetical protein
MLSLAMNIGRMVILQDDIGKLLSRWLFFGDFLPGLLKQVV